MSNISRGFWTRCRQALVGLMADRARPPRDAANLVRRPDGTPHSIVNINSGNGGGGGA